MKYRFIDEVVALELGASPRIEIRKTFARADDAFSGPGGSRQVPESLLLELMAMAGGHLIFHRLDATRLPLLVKVPECRFERSVGPDIRLSATAELVGISPDADPARIAETRAEVYADGGRVASARLLYVCVSVPGLRLGLAEELE